MFRQIEGSLYDAVLKMLSDYPGAVRSNPGNRSLAVMVGRGEEKEFFYLCHQTHPHGPMMWISPMGSNTRVYIELDGSCKGRELADRVLTDGLPVPRNGAMHAWISERELSAGGHVATALVGFEYNPFPAYVVAPFVDADRENWPPFTGKDLTSEYWRFLMAGNLVDVAELLSATPETVYYAKYNGRKYVYVTKPVVSEAVILPTGVSVGCGELLAPSHEFPTPSLTLLSSLGIGKDVSPWMRNWLESGVAST